MSVVTICRLCTKYKYKYMSETVAVQTFQVQASVVFDVGNETSEHSERAYDH